MTILVYAENTNGVYKKSAFEAVSYAKNIAEKAGASVTAIAINPTETSDALYQYGADKVLVIKNENLSFNPKSYAQIMKEVSGGEIVVFPHSNDASSVAAMFSTEVGISLITNANDVPESISPFVVKKKVFSGKGFSLVQAKEGRVALTISPNSFGVKENPVAGTEEIINVNIENNDIKIISQEQTSGKIDLKEAEIVVSAGRGMKAPENWGMIEDLANTLGAAMACSKPVSDIGWRPHNEHVGQTGKAIAPNLYIAVGISGAIQHLAGVNSSKTIVVINNDAEAPFFKAADYGVVGDAFQIVPELTKKIKELKG